MATEHLPFGAAGMMVIGGYVVALLVIGWLGQRAVRENTLSDFYLAGRHLGLVTLFLTMYATQYSGNTLLMFSGKAYALGFTWLMSVQFMTVIIVGLLVIGPRLRVVCRRANLITPPDYVLHRFNAPMLSLLVSVIMIFVAGNYTIAQMRAMGAFITGLSGGAIPMTYGVIGLAVIMVLYETLGGMRSVAWTDALQGIILFTAFFVLLVVLRVEFGSFATATATVAKTAPEKVRPPDGDHLRMWCSYLVLFGLGASCYPMAIQRLYAARNAKTLKHSIVLMAFMPLCTTLIALITGIYAASQLASVTGTDTVLPRLCAIIVEVSPLGHVLVLTIFAAVLAALMSTADSALLSIASMATRDIYARYINPRATQAALSTVSKRLSWFIMGALVFVALQDIGDLKQLLDIKFEMLVQVAPAFFLGLHTRVAARPIAAGLVVGVAAALAIRFAWSPTVAGIHAGTIGLVANAAVVWLVQAVETRSTQQGVVRKS
ncbi:MAG: sodium:solute symporter [Phycisphaerae bacterium]